MPPDEFPPLLPPEEPLVELPLVPVPPLVPLPILIPPPLPTPPVPLAEAPTPEPAPLTITQKSPRLTRSPQQDTPESPSNLIIFSIDVNWGTHRSPDEAGHSLRVLSLHAQISFVASQHGLSGEPCSPRPIQSSGSHRSSHPSGVAPAARRPSTSLGVTN